MPGRRARPDAREVARRVLRRVGRDGAFANLVLSAELERAGLPPRDRGLATELVYGVLRHRRRLDHALARHCQRPLDRLDTDTLDALRLGAYQLLLLDRIPAHAAVNDAVGAVRAGRGRTLAGFANAVLRRLVPEDLQAGSQQDPLQRFALECSLPDWLASHWASQLGQQDAEALGRALLQRAPLTARVNPMRGELAEAVAMLEAEGATVEPGGVIPGALQVSGLVSPFTSASYLAGRWTVQDQAAQAAGVLLGPAPGEVVLDACAGVGGKATHLAALMGDRGEVICVDHSPRKLELLAEHCLRLGLSCCRPLQGDLLQPSTLSGLRADRVLLDAPCSGLGVMRHHPELKWRPSSMAEVRRLAQQQRELLARVVPALRPGGVLVYCVCTTTDEEGPENLAWLRGAFPALSPLPPDHGPLRDLASPDGSLRLWPHRHGCDGFFLCRVMLEKTGGVS